MAGQVAYEGALELYAQRIDVTTGQPVDAPDITATRALDQHRAARLARIAELESKQHRPLRELTRDPQNAEARRRLDEIDSEIAQLRAQI